MSQTTRCPACHTRFKVVADQLRISDGWVRCGHCKQVFDASVSLEPGAPEPMLADMRLDQLRGPVERVVGPSSEPRAWGSGGGQGSADGASARDVIAPPESISEPENSDDLDDGFAVTQIGSFDPEPAAPSPALPEHVPAFLKTSLSLASDSLRPPAGQPLQADSSLREPGERVGPAARRLAADLEKSPDGSRHRIDPTWQDPWTTAAGPSDDRGAASPPAAPVGYELPGAQIEDIDSDWPALFDELAPDEVAPSPKAERQDSRDDAAEPDLAHFLAEVAEWSTEQTGKAAPTPTAPPALPMAATPSEAVAQIAPTAAAAAAAKPRALAEAAAPTLPTEPQPAEEPPDAENPDWTLVQDVGPEERLQGPITEPPQPTEPRSMGSAAVADPQAWDAADLELSFVRHARRRAFWSGAGVRAGLVVALLVLLLALAAQIGMHERARLAAMWPQSRALWTLACSYLNCTVGAYRDMGAVVVDGSSFNRVQGERYQLALTLRNRAALAVEAPAIELTLTDTEDQPVLRRILMPAELAMTNPLRAGAEWSAVIPMSIATSAPRIAGYRVLAFYP